MAAIFSASQLSLICSKPSGPCSMVLVLADDASSCSDEDIQCGSCHDSDSDRPVALTLSGCPSGKASAAIHVSDSDSDGPLALQAGERSRGDMLSGIREPTRHPRGEMHAKSQCRGHPVEGQAECFGWAEESFRILLHVSGESLYQKLGKKRWTASTYFSGLGTAELAMDMLRAAFPVFARAPFFLEAVSACEKRRSLQDVLLQRTSGCVFGDIFDRLSGIESKTLPVGEFEKQLADCIVADGQYCLQHKTMCRAPSALISIAGTPCRPWSIANRGVQRHSQHEDMKVFLAWARIMRHDQPTLIIHENVVAFDDRLLLRVLGDLYEIVYCLRVSPSDAGFGFVRRDRKYHLLALKSSKVSCSRVYDIYSLLVAGLVKNVGTWSEWVWRASLAELDEEFAVCSQRKSDSATKALGGSSRWRSLLTACQAEYLDRYIAMWQTKHVQRPEETPSCVFDLGDAPEYRGVPTILQLRTLRLRHSILWSPLHGRWMTRREKAACMGFPVYDDLARKARVPLDVSTVKCSAAIGNAMHVANIGTVLLATMFSIDWPMPPQPSRAGGHPNE